jgi:hypothetical protein
VEEPVKFKFIGGCANGQWIDVVPFTPFFFVPVPKSPGIWWERDGVTPALEIEEYRLTSLAGDKENFLLYTPKGWNKDDLIRKLIYG